MPRKGPRGGGHPSRGDGSMAAHPSAQNRNVAQVLGQTSASDSTYVPTQCRKLVIMLRRFACDFVLVFLMAAVVFALLTPRRAVVRHQHDRSSRADRVLFGEVDTGTGAPPHHHSGNSPPTAASAAGGGMAPSRVVDGGMSLHGYVGVVEHHVAEGVGLRFMTVGKSVVGAAYMSKQFQGQVRGQG